MADYDTKKLEALLKQEILSETAKIPWTELQRFFAAGKTIYVAATLDLVDVALQIANDNDGQMKQWVATSQVAPVSDDQARYWIDTDATVWAVVVKPYVLVQELKHDQRDARS